MNQPRELELTVRSVLVGALIGVVMCLSNLYIVLKTGWSIGVTVTACIVAWALFSSLAALRVTKRPFGLLENNMTGTVASAAGYMTGGGNMAALPALVMLTGVRPDAALMVFWFAAIGVLGVFAAIPIKRQLINEEKLAFPTGTATAETLRALYSQDGGGAQKAKWLGLAALFGALIAFLRDAKAKWLPFNLPSNFGLPVTLGGRPLVDWTLGFEASVLMLGAGGLMSFRTGWSMLLGALVTYGLLAPWMVDAGVIHAVSYKGIVAWSVWPGAAVLVASGLTAFAFQWRSVAQSFAGLRQALRGSAAPDDGVEVPQKWLPLGFLLVGPVVVYLCWKLFAIPVWAGLLALPLALLMGTIAARVTGETDVTPTKALGPVTQLIYGALLPQQLVPNLMSANVTGGVGLHAADLLTVMKTGHLVGAKPRLQFIAQLFGVLAGAAVIVPAFNLIVPDAAMLGSAEFPAPGAQVWAGVSKMLAEGVSSLHPTARWAALAGALLGVVLGVLEVKVPKAKRAWLPSASGIGIAMVIPGFSSVMMWLGTVVAEVLRRRYGEKRGDDVSIPVASGFIAGESLMGIVVKMLVAFGVMAK